MDIKGMRYFISAAENLSFTKTAMEQNVTQTAISLSISKMEEELGFQLFTRKNRAVQLTEAGRDFYERIVDVVKRYEEAVDHGQKTATGKVGELRIAVPDCIIGMSLIPSFHAFQTSYPQLYMKALIIPPHKIIQSIANHEIDAAIGFPQEFEGASSLQYRVFRTDKLVVAMSPYHPLASLPVLSLDQVSSLPVTVVHPQKAPMVDRYMYGLWERVGFKPQQVIHSPTLDDALLEVSIGNAIILITEQSQQFLSPALSFHRLKEFESLGIEIALAWDKSRENPILKGLIWALLGNH